eukprot:jgi/Orpsp1_1/1179765/evm.model.c7180000070683.1
MNFKNFYLLIANALLCTSVRSHLYERDYEPLSGQGDITYYGEGGSDPAPTDAYGGSPGACALAPRNKNYFAALNYVQYGEYANPNNSVVCGRCVKLVYGSNEVVVEIVDKCPVCPSGDVDIAPTAFIELFGSKDIGRVHNVKWYEVSCDELGKNKGYSNSNTNPIQNNPDTVQNPNSNPIALPNPVNDNKNIVNNDWNNNNQNIPNVTTKTIPNNNITTKTVPNNNITTKTIPKTTTKTVPKTYTIKTRTPKTINTEKTDNAEKLPTPITITTSTVVTAVFTIPITTVITDYNYYQAAPTGLPSKSVPNNNGSYQCYAN